MRAPDLSPLLRQPCRAFRPHCADGRPALHCLRHPWAWPKQRRNAADPQAPTAPLFYSELPSPAPETPAPSWRQARRCGGRIPARARRYPGLGSPRHGSTRSARPAPAASCPCCGSRHGRPSAQADAPRAPGPPPAREASHDRTASLVPARRRPGARRLRQRVARWPSRRCGPAHRRPHRWRASCLARSRRCGQSAGARIYPALAGRAPYARRRRAHCAAQQPWPAGPAGGVGRGRCRACASHHPAQPALQPGALCQQPRARDRAHAGVQPARPHHPALAHRTPGRAPARSPPCKPRKTW